MALSDVIKKIEDSPRSTKVAVLAVGVAIAASAVAVFTVLNQADSGTEPASVAKAAPVDASPNTQTGPASSAPQPVPTAIPTNTPSPVPTSTPEPTPTPAATPTPVATPTPAATPTPEVNDYYVVIHQGRILNDGTGIIEYYADYPFHRNARGTSFPFYNEEFYLEYLRKEGVITSEQKNAYFNYEPIKVPLVPISTATYKLHQTDGHNASKVRLRDPKYLFHYADKSLDYSESVSSVETVLASSDGGSITISDGKISVSAVDDDGNATTVQLEGIGAKELLEYWLSQSKITVQQVNQYGQTGQMQISLKDGVDLFNFASSSGADFGIDKETQDKIVNELLPLFKFGD